MIKPTQPIIANAKVFGSGTAVAVPFILRKSMLWTVLKFPELKSNRKLAELPLAIENGEVRLKVVSTLLPVSVPEVSWVFVPPAQRSGVMKFPAVCRIVKLSTMRLVPVAFPTENERKYGCAAGPVFVGPQALLPSPDAPPRLRFKFVVPSDMVAPLGKVGPKSVRSETVTPATADVLVTA